MRLTPPKQIVFWISVILVVLGLVGKYLIDIPFVTDYNFYFLLVGYVLLFLGNAVKGF